MPSDNVEFWEKKFVGTLERDKRNTKELRSLGWKVLTVWQCELSDLDKLIRKLQKSIER